MDNEAESETAITTEIERYMAIPDKPCPINWQLKIMELRKERQNGREFDIKKFHEKC
jgi:uncharacterized protein (DUF885 family)